MSNVGDDDNVLRFKSAKQPHVVSRAEGKIEAIRNAFKLSREEANPPSKKGKKKRKKKKH